MQWTELFELSLARLDNLAECVHKVEMAGLLSTQGILGESGRMKSLKISLVALIAIGVLAIAPSAFADSFNLTTNNLGLSGVLGTVTTAQNGSNVTVTVQMSPGYAILVNGGELGFNTNGLALTNGSLSNFSVSMSASLKNNATVGSFTFDSLFKTSGSGGQQFPTTLTFTIANANVSQISGLGLHFCVVSQAGGCATTGFVVTTPGSPTPVPEPGTLTLVGTSLLSLAGVVRRRLGA